MYKYSQFDTDFVRQRNAEFRAQIKRRLDGSLTEDEFKPLRLMNGLYLQLHAYMLRVAIPYGSLNGRQMRQLAMIAQRWDKGYGHFTTRQNIQFNWPKLPDVPIFSTHWATWICMRSRPRETPFQTSLLTILPALQPTNLRTRALMPN